MQNYPYVCACSILLGCFLLFACGSDSTMAAPNPRTITVTINNLDALRAAHIYIGEGEPSEENLVPPKGSIIAMVLAPRMGHSVTVHVAQDKPGSLPFYSRSVRVTQTAWEARAAELRWTGSEIIPVGW